MNKQIKKIKGGLIVSCQADEGSPFDSPEDVTKFAVAAVQGGAAGIRSNGLEKTNMIILNVKLPVIGLIKSKFDDGSVRITGSALDAENLCRIGTHIIAIDGTFRKREGMTGPEFIRKIKSKLKCAVMADCSSLDEAIACADEGADCVSTTLHGYTPETMQQKSDYPDLELLKSFIENVHVPVIAEGRYNMPELAAKAIELGAWSVVVGTAITRPAVITKWFSDSIKQLRKNQ